jgi:hypothetical protein
MVNQAVIKEAIRLTFDSRRSEQDDRVLPFDLSVVASLSAENGRI